jgi:hypothetical protein
VTSYAYHFCQREVPVSKTQPGQQPTGRFDMHRICEKPLKWRLAELFAPTEGSFCQRAALFPRLQGEVSPFPELSTVSSYTTC